MLVLTRREHESIILDTANGHVAITVVRIAGNSVRIGIAASEEVNIRREELKQKQKEKRNGYIT